VARSAARSRTSAFQRMTLLLSRGRALTDDFRSLQLPTAEHRTRFVCLGAATCTLPVGTCPVPYRTGSSNRWSLRSLLTVTLLRFPHARAGPARRRAVVCVTSQKCAAPGRRSRDTQHQKTLLTDCSPSLRLTFTTARFAGAPSSDGLAGVGAVGVSRSLAPRAGLPLHVRRIPNHDIRSDNLSSVGISSCSGTRSLTRRRTRRTGTHSALDRCPPLPAPACPCPLCALRRRSHRA